MQRHFLPKQTCRKLGRASQAGMTTELATPQASYSFQFQCTDITGATEKNRLSGLQSLACLKMHLLD